MFRRLKQQASATIGHAHATMSDAQALLAFARDFLADVADGVEFSIVRTGDATVKDFLEGKVDELPLKLKMKVDEEAP